MHPAVFRTFAAITQELGATGHALEVGAVPGPDSLLNLPALATLNRTGINLSGGSGDGYDIVAGNANHMPQFADGSFDLVLSNATLEHDPKFWLTVAEIHRVLKPGGWLIVGVPGYDRYRWEKLETALGLIPGLRRLRHTAHGNAAFTATPTLHVHNAPGDYYRFSRQAVEQVFLAGLEERSVQSIMTPPRIIGKGRKPA